MITYILSYHTGLKLTNPNLVPLGIVFGLAACYDGIDIQMTGGTQR